MGCASGKGDVKAAEIVKRIVPGDTLDPDDYNLENSPYNFTKDDYIETRRVVNKAIDGNTFDFNNVIVITSQLEKNRHIAGHYIAMGQIYNDAMIFCRLKDVGQHLEIDMYLFRVHTTPTFPQHTWRIGSRPDFQVFATCAGYDGTDPPIGKGEWSVPCKVDSTVSVVKLDTVDTSSGRGGGRRRTRAAKARQHYHELSPGRC